MNSQLGDINILWIHVKMLWIHNSPRNFSRMAVLFFDRSRYKGSDFLSSEKAGSSCLAQSQCFVNLLFISVDQSWEPMKAGWQGNIFFRISFQDLKNSVLALLHSHVLCRVQKELVDSHPSMASINNARWSSSTCSLVIKCNKLG